MSFPKLLVIGVIALLGTIGYFAWKKQYSETPAERSLEIASIEITGEECREAPEDEIERSVTNTLLPKSQDKDLPVADRISQLFQPFPPSLPIVETISYTSRVDWLKGRPAYLGDYANHFQTSRDFISRSLKGKGNYTTQAVSNGDRFNVYKKDRPLEFHLVLDLSRLKLWLYYFDKVGNERVLLKTYPVCAGRLDDSRPSGSLTPLGTYTLGSDTAAYKEGVMGTFNQKTKEMISIFGVRWIPFDCEVADCTASSKGLGLHGVPWKRDEAAGQLAEYKECIGRYESGGCVRLLTEDIEELFAVVTSKPSIIHIVKDFQDAKLPGFEKNPTK